MKSVIQLLMFVFAPVQMYRDFLLTIVEIFVRLKEVGRQIENRK